MSKLGVELHKTFAIFRVWAPFAKNVAVQGDFSNWTEIAMTKKSGGVWEVKITDVEAGQSYRYIITTQDDKRLEKNDPRARALTDGDNGVSVIATDDFDWGNDDDFQMQPRDKQVVYEMHIGTFNRPDAATSGTFATASEKLDYLRDLGITTIELMPVTAMAMGGGGGGWGYSPRSIYAVQDSYGGAAGLKSFIKAAHERGIAVVLDIVYNHFFSDTLWQFDGWSEDGHGGIYFYSDERGNTPWGERPDYGRSEVRDFILDNVAMWLADYHLDGLRLDSTIYMRNVNGKNNDPAGDIADAWKLLQDITTLAHKIKPEALMIAEDCAGNEWITKSVADGGCGFDAQWDLGLPHVIRGALGVAGEPSGLSHLTDVMQQNFNGDFYQKVIFADSHDTAANGGS
ncbi:MAG: 1,4-alpha-glucan branching protein, partial [Candidatus Nomurabacteria bacterium]|nr:1,4-alpha-glucan branching protein [Candidatus Nomurabacteria bacterium]